MEQPRKASFFTSVISGIAGYVKGALAGGVVGALAGAAVGAIIGLATGGAPLLIGTALLGAQIGGGLMASIGALAGTITGVVKSREAAQPSADDIVKVAKISYTQGVTVGHQIAQAQEQEQTKFRDKIRQERGVSPLGQQIH